MIIFAFKKIIQTDCFRRRARKDVSGTVRGTVQVRYECSSV